ncbi:MAG: Ig-like domain-containing protein, partial [Thermoanaerobaculia bacterium]
MADAGGLRTVWHPARRRQPAAAALYISIIIVSPAPGLVVAQEEENALLGAGELVKLLVEPQGGTIRGADRTQSLVVTGVYQNGGLRDLTSEAVYSVSDPAVAAVASSGLVRPAGDGAARVAVSAGGLRAEAEVTVSHTRADLPLSFPNDLVPIFSKHGCNSGGCHGKSGGQNGFQLSLFGFVPEVDYGSLTRESRGRRVFPAAPEHSLLLRKATAALPHGGGERFKPGSPDYDLLHRWMRSGMPFGKPDDPTVTGIAVYPRHRALERGARQQLRVTARYSDGRIEDVTRRAEYSTGEEDYLQVSSEGRVTVLDLPGQGSVLVRYRGQVGLFSATIPYRGSPAKLARPP